MRRHRRLLAGLAVVIVAVAACLPGLTAIDYAVFELPWTLLPPPAQAPLALADTTPGEPAVPFLPGLPSRAPPAGA